MLCISCAGETPIAALHPPTSLPKGELEADVSIDATLEELAQAVTVC